MQGRKNKNKEMKKKLIQNKIQDFKNTFFQKSEFHYEPTCEVKSV
jgi:hypothetical protein